MLAEAAEIVVSASHVLICIELESRWLWYSGRYVMTLDSLRLLRNILLRSAALCYAFMIVSALIWVPLSDTWTGLTSNLYLVPAETVHNIVVWFLTAAKFLAIFVLLIPGLALHWTIKRETAK